MTEIVKLGSKFKINGAGYRPTEVWEVIDVSDKGISVIDVRERRFGDSREAWTVLDIPFSTIASYERQNFLQAI